MAQIHGMVQTACVVGESNQRLSFDQWCLIVGMAAKGGEWISGQLYTTSQ
jgi:hypothetical protein